MDRYNILKDARQFAITKRWTAYIGNLFHWFFFLVPVLFIWLISRTGRRPAPLPMQWLLWAVPTIGIAAIGLYTVWKIVRGGDTFLFDARTHLFERNGHVVSHWDGISQIVVVDVPHQRDRRGRMLRTLLDQEEYTYTYRLVVLLSNGKKHVLDECGDKQTISDLAQEIATYTGKFVSSDLASAGWLS